MPVSIAGLGSGAPCRAPGAGAAVWAATLSGAAAAAAPATAAPFSKPRRVTSDPRILAIGPSLHPTRAYDARRLVMGLSDAGQTSPSISPDFPPAPTGTRRRDLIVST